MAETTYFTPDVDVPERHQATLAKYRLLAAEHGVPATTPVCYRVRAGFTLKTHAPKAGPCYENYAYLQNWNFPDEPTKNSLVFWVPRVLRASTSKTGDEQLQLLADLRVKLGLPAHHLNGFGPVGLVAGLILAHRHATGERIPKNYDWVRTDSRRADGGRLRLRLGDFNDDGLGCGDWDFLVGARG